MNKLKIGLGLIFLGNILYFVYNMINIPNDFIKGLVLGLSAGVNIIGIILSVIYISENTDSKNKKWTGLISMV